LRFLSDSQTQQPFVELLRRLGWDVETANEAGLAGKVPDYKLVHYATQWKRIFLTFDQLRAEAGIRVARELRQNGGKVIKIMGGPDQNPYRAVGKLLFHYPEWESHLNAKNGVSVISDTKQSCKNYTPRQYHQKYHPTDANQFEKYLAKRKAKHPRKKRIKKATLSDQAPLL